MCLVLEHSCYQCSLFGFDLLNKNRKLWTNPFAHTTLHAVVLFTSLDPRMVITERIDLIRDFKYLLRAKCPTVITLLASFRDDVYTPDRFGELVSIDGLTNQAQNRSRLGPDNSWRM